MRRSRSLALLVALLSLIGGAVAVAREDPAGPLAAAEDAADEAAQNGRELVDEAAEEQGFGSEAFRARHRMLAEKFEEMGHPVFDEHPAARVHRALANGEHPPGGPPDHAGRPDHAGPKGDHAEDD